MGALSNYFPLGLGTSRLPVKNLTDLEGIDRSAKLILKTLDTGINYIDTSYPYSGGAAHAALKLAFAQTKKTYSVTVKVLCQSDRTADDARRRVESQFKSLGIDRAGFFLCWSISSFEQFIEFTRNGGIYDGAQKLKDEGVIDHICCSLHASTVDSIKIIESGLFEAATISFNLANAVQTLPLLDAALEHNVDVAVMNPLGGGGIPQNPEFFSFAQAPGEDTITAALRFAKSHPAVKIVLSGLNNENELEENHKALTNKSNEQDFERLTRVINRVKDIDGYCVNCHYCDECPIGIPVSKIMDKHNRLLFPNIETQDYRRQDSELLKNINLFFGQAGADNNNEWFPVSYENPCIRCKQCEMKCTQKLKIADSLDEMYERAHECGFVFQSRKDRLHELLLKSNKNYKTVGLYPKDKYADLVVKLFKSFFGEPAFNWVAFNSDSGMWGKTIDGLMIHAPSEIPSLKPDIIIVCNYTYDNEIYNDLQKYKDDGIEVVKLHRETDVPWVF